MEWRPKLRNPRLAGKHSELDEVGQDTSPRAFAGGHSSANALILDFQPSAWVRINSCCFKAPGFVMLFFLQQP